MAHDPTDIHDAAVIFFSSDYLSITELIQESHPISFIEDIVSAIFMKCPS
jgi:hypothetical protein